MNTLSIYLKEIQTNYLKLWYADQSFESVMKIVRFNSKNECSSYEKVPDYYKKCFKKHIISQLLFDVTKSKNEVKKYCGDNKDSMAKKYCKHIKNWPKRFEEELLKYKRIK